MAKSGAAAAAGRTVEEVKSELRRLVRAITDEGDGRIETLKDAARALEALTDLQFKRRNGGAIANSNTKRPSPLSPQKPPQPPNQIGPVAIPAQLKPQQQHQPDQIETVAIPDQFLCPISSEIMKDPVVLVTGETYDRLFIEEWLHAGNRTCPRTQQILSDLNVVPNNVVRRMISEWCVENGINLPQQLDNPDEGVVTRSERNRLNGLLNVISTSSSSILEKKQAVKELRLLTKQHPSYRAVLGESPDAVPKLLSVLSAPGLDGDPEVQEDTVTTILNLSIHDSNKKTIGEIPQVIPLLIDALKTGTMESRSNAAAALFTLSALDSNKTRISDLGAMRPLMELLEQGSLAAKRDAASAIFNLCISHDNRARAVREGAVGILLKCIDDRSLVDESLAVLALVASDQEAVDEVGDSGGVPCLLRIMRESSCGKNKENAAVVLFSVCMNDRTKLREVREEEALHATISRLAETGTSRGRRKAAGILDRVRRTIYPTHNSC